MRKSIQEVRKSMQNPSQKPYTFVTLDDNQASEAITFSMHTLPKGRIVPAHWHNYIELEIVANGTAEHIISNKSYTLSKGSAYLMTSCDFHMIIPTSDITVYNISIMRGIIDDGLEKCLTMGLNRFHCTFDSEKLLSVIELFERAQSESGMGPFSTLMRKNIAEELIVSLIRASEFDEIVSTSNLIQKAIIIINDRFMHPLTLKKVAEELYLSPNYLGLMFKNEVGCSFNTCLTMTRIGYACGLLNSTNKTVKEVAFESGFSSNEYFLSQFKKIVKCTPSEYRKQHSSL